MTITEIGEKVRWTCAGCGTVLETGTCSLSEASAIFRRKGWAVRTLSIPNGLRFEKLCGRCSIDS